ncbi:TPA: hypothetical protein PNO69_004545 [Salmonella enterica]|nr:hypothetical protein [Salmonella enterica]HCH9607988.1 hypothetical protein [Salmonella enterica]HDI5000282.1 hypothetical protein [Salmonella enterica]HDI5005103.1 hypothetical protein [Salmonella enterica]
MNKLSYYVIKFYEKLWCLFTVSYWIQLYDDYPYSASKDAWMRQSLKEGHKLEIIDNFHAKFNGRVLWIENIPYASFHLDEKGKTSVSPARYTKYLLNKQLKKLNKEKKKKLVEGWK